MTHRRLLMVFAMLLIWGAGYLYIVFFHGEVYRCTSRYTLIFEDEVRQETTISQGEMMWVFYGDFTGSSVYTGTITRRGAQGLERRFSVNRTLLFDYRFKPHELLSTTTQVITGMNDTADDNDVARYVYGGFISGKTMHGTLFILAHRYYSIGESLYPKSLCVPPE